MGRVIVSAAAVYVLAATLVAQQTTPTFEVASIRPSGNSVGDDSSEVQPSGRFAVTNVVLYELFRFASELKEHEIAAGEGLPSWVKTERWDIIGKGPPITDETAQRPLLFAMMRNLLIERFKLVTRREEREIPVYALVVAREDRRLGPQMRPSSADCAALLAAFKATGATFQTPDSPTCGLRRLRGQLALIRSRGQVS
jgi:uncharacterized protein (TIGR03435 family)